MRHALILAGGQGTRLWPLSTAQRPKQLVPMPDGRTLLDRAVERGSAVAGELVWLVAGEALVDGAVSAGIRRERVVVEPSGRDTLAAVALGCARIAASDPGAVVVVLTADHVVEPVTEVAAVLSAGAALAEEMPSALVTFGVVPDSPATGYGYLEVSTAVGPARRVDVFREKPPREEAERYLAAGPDRYLWNSGMFVWVAETFLDAVRRLAPEHAVATRPDPPLSEWSALGRRSVDVGVMEPASVPGSGYDVLALPLGATWLDVGSWSAYAATVPLDGDGNRVGARSVLLDAHGVVVVSDDPDHLVAVLGCSDLVVVHTAGATLVVPAAQAQRVKDLQALVAEQVPDRA